MKLRIAHRITRVLRRLLAMTLVGCMHNSPAPANGIWISSDSSQYSPDARFRAFSRIGPTGVHISIDSGSLSVPGMTTPGMPPVMSQLYITAILAVPDSDSFAIVRPAARGAPAERRSWHPLASSDSVLLVKELHYGERAAFRAIELLIPSPALPAGPAWIIYRITGDAVMMRPPLTPGGLPQRLDRPGGVRVYACGDRDVRGSFDPSRAASLRRAYGIAC